MQHKQEKRTMQKLTKQRDTKEKDQTKSKKHTKNHKHEMSVYLSKQEQNQAKPENRKTEQ